LRRVSTAITWGCQPYSRNGFIASPITTSGSLVRRVCAASRPAQSSSVWKTRRVLTGASLTPAATPGPAITSGTCMVAW
jgi:hypothetical protein